MNLENQFKVINLVLKYEIKRGHLKWKVTEIARLTKIHRNLIYYHFGKTKKDIFNKSLEIITAEFYGTSPRRMKYIEQGNFYGCIAENFKFFREYPDFILFYNLNRSKDSAIQKKLIEIEKNYQIKLKNLYPHLKPHEISALHSTIHGAVSSPILDEQSFKTVIKSIVGPFLYSLPHVQKKKIHRAV